MPSEDDTVCNNREMLRGCSETFAGYGKRGHSNSRGSRAFAPR